MKFSLFFNAYLLFFTYHFTLCEDWTHSGENNDNEEDESRERQEAKNLQIPSISLPWVKTSCQHLFTIPKSFLVQINREFKNDHLIRTPFFCRVEVIKGVKIIGMVSAPETANVHFP